MRLGRLNFHEGARIIGVICSLISPDLVQSLFSGGGVTSRRVIDSVGTRTSSDFNDDFGNDFGPAGGEAQPGRCYNFDGVNDLVTTGVPSNFSTNVTIYAEIIPDVVAGSNSGAFRITQLSATASTRFGIAVDNSKVVMIYNTGGFNISPGVAIAAGDHARVCVTTDGATRRLYVNGVLIDDITAGAQSPTNAALIQIGQLAGFREFDGKIWNVQYYDTVLTEEECIQLTTDGLPLLDNLYAIYKMDEGAGLVSYDSSGNARHGSISNATLSTFHSTDPGVEYSWQNETGYSDGINAIPRSEEFDNAIWVKARTSVTANAAIAPDGSVTADQITTTGTSNAYTQVTGLDVGDTDVVTISLYVQNIDAGWCNLLVWDGGSNGTRCRFNVSLGAVGSVTTFGSGFEFNNLTITSAGGLRWRISATTNIAGTSLNARINVAEDDGSLAVTSGVALLLWGAQLEAGSLPTNYQRTLGNGVLGALLPFDESTPTQDILGNDLQYTGRVKYNAELVNSNCATFDGVNDYIDTGIMASASGSIEVSFILPSVVNDRLIIGTQSGNGRAYIGVNNNVIGGGVGDQAFTIIQGTTTLQANTAYTAMLSRDGSNVSLSLNGELEYNGTQLGTPNTTHAIYIGGGNNSGSLLLPVAGNIYNVIIRSGTNTLGYYPLAEGSGTTAYDVSGNSNHGTITNATLSSFRGTTQDVFHRNITQGFTQSGSVLVPALADGTADATGQTLTNPAGERHNNAETELRMIASPAMILADRGINFWFDANGNPNDVSYDDIIENRGDTIFANVSVDDQKNTLVTYNSPRTADTTPSLECVLSQL